MRPTRRAFATNSDLSGCEWPSVPPLKALTFIAIHQAVWGLYMGCSFAPNHKGMPIVGANEKLDYLRRQVLTARNVRGGLNRPGVSGDSLC